MTTFYLTLPVLPAATEAKKMKPAPTHAPMTAFNKGRILFAEDHPGILQMISGFLRDQGYLVTAVGNGSQAYERLHDNDYDVVILDINMPVMDGVEAVKAIRERNQHSYILMISGDAEPSAVREDMRLGANAFLAKPFTLENLQEHIAEIDFDMCEWRKKMSARIEARKNCADRPLPNRIADFIHECLA